jgi:hypothetical protein
MHSRRFRNRSFEEPAMRPLISALIFASLPWSGAFGYGGGGGSSGCEEPHFFEPKPAGTVASLTEFTFIASDNTEPDTITVNVNGQKIHPEVTQRRSGDYAAKLVLPAPVTTAGTFRLGIDAKSKGGCWGFKPHAVEIKP